jgi:hypothetical protein
MNRRELVKLGAVQAAMVAVPVTGGMVAQAAAKSGSPGNAKTLTLSNTQFALTVTAGAGLECKLVHRPTGAVLAEGSYSYSFGTPVFSQAQQEGSALVLQGSIPGTGMTIQHRFKADPGSPWIEEELEFSNQGELPLDLHDARAGFVLPIPLQGKQVPAAWAEYKFTAIPFRREPAGHMAQYADFTLSQILTEQYSSELWSEQTTVTSAFASEGWALTDGKHGFLITKYSPGGLEFAVLDRVVLSPEKFGLRWGGIGIYRGKPEHGAWLRPGETHRFGVTRVTAYAGDWLQGFYGFRREMEQRGHGCPKGFNPPVHWNELYDNKLWWLPGDEQDDPEMRKKYYTLDSMKEEAAKAKDIGCEALYMDPGWDTSFSSKIWDEARLGPYPSFTKMLQQDYGLKSSLHTPLSGWCDPSSYPVAANRVDRFGKRRMWDRATGFLGSPLCGSSDQYINTTADRLKTLAKGGAAFFMFDGTNYHEECWDPNHGHQVPARLEEHDQARSRLARMVHEEYPDVLIEMHNPPPIYYGHGHCPEGQGACEGAGFDTIWGFELMWMPMQDLLSGHSIALYYYNLAYSLPIYLHIDLRTDNRNALVFWWNASTCRHLGIGGTHPDAAVRTAQKEGMANYRRLKPYFAAATFYGIDEQTHVHSDEKTNTAVMNCFNLSNVAIEKEIRFDSAQLGLSPAKTYQFSGGSFHRSADVYVGKVSIPAEAHTLIEIT